MTHTGQTSANADSRFAPDTFAPHPHRSAPTRLFLAQARIESILFLRHGEQILLSLIIPLGLLIGLSLMPVPLEDPVHMVFPMSMAIALMSAGFTGQAIAVAFDRRYGALKRIGASGVPTWALIAGKVAAVGAAVATQLLLLTIVAVFLGWKPVWMGLPISIAFIVVGVAAFTSLGLLLGGTLGSEMVLAMANTAWFILMGAAVFATMFGQFSPSEEAWMTLIPSVALTRGFQDAVVHGHFNLLAFAVLLAWGVLGSALALRFFKFTMDSD